MLLSFYASFRWARGKHYFVKIATLIILVSFFSAYVGVCMAWFFFGPLPVFSFPFYAIQDEMHGSPIPPLGHSHWIPTYRIMFLTMEISSLKADDSVDVGTYHFYGYHVLFLNHEIGYIDEHSSADPVASYRLTFPLLLFLLVNSAGAGIGFVVSKWNALKKSEYGLKGILGQVALGVVILVTGIFLSNFAVATTIRSPPWTGNYYTLTLYPYRKDAGAFVVFGIAWLAIMILESALWARRWFNSSTGASSKPPLAPNR